MGYLYHSISFSMQQCTWFVGSTITAIDSLAAYHQPNPGTSYESDSDREN